MKNIVLILLIGFFITNLFSYSLLNRFDGDFVGVLDARSIGMGSTGVAGGINLLDFMVNPANISFLQPGINVEAGGKLIIASDKRSLPMYNSFDAYSDDAVYVSNTNYYLNPALAVSYDMNFNDYNLSLGLNYRNYISFTSNYQEEVRNNENSDFFEYPHILADNTIETSGNIDAAGFLISAKYTDFIALGLETALLFGETSQKRKVIWSEWAQGEMQPDVLPDTVNTLKRDFEGLLFRIGTRAKISNRIQLGFSITPSVDLDVTGDYNDSDLNQSIYLYLAEQDSAGVLTINDSITYADYKTPLRLRAGFSYQPRNIMRTYFNFDLEYVKWSDLNPLYDDHIDYFVGLEHKFRNKIPLRLGFKYETEYGMHLDSGLVFADKVTMPSFSIGTGFVFMERFSFDLALEYGNRQYETLDLFNDSYYDYEDLWANYYYVNLQDRGWENPDKVEETFVEVSSSLSFKW